MSTRFVKTVDLSNEEKLEVSVMTGKLILMMLEKRSIKYMSEQLKLSPKEVMYNISETLYTLRKQVGWRHYLRVLFWR